MGYRTVVRFSNGLPYICPSCKGRLQTQFRLGVSPFQKRFITQNYLRKSLEAKLAWARQATKIKDGKQDSMLSVLEKRGYVNQIVGYGGKASPIYREAFDC